jgi:hypothetical protein
MMMHNRHATTNHVYNTIKNLEAAHHFLQSHPKTRPLGVILKPRDAQIGHTYMGAAQDVMLGIWMRGHLIVNNHYTTITTYITAIEQELQAVSSSALKRAVAEQPLT